MNEIVVALDQMNRHKALEFAAKLEGKVWGFKVNDLLIEYGCNIVADLKRFGKVFADPKLHDIPNTVYNCVDHLCWAGADLITCHLSGGVEMLTAAKNACEKHSKRQKSHIIGVTMLTSLTPGNIRQVYRGFPLERLCELANKGNVDGVVCAAQEIPFWNLFNNFIKVVPGVRPFGKLPGDDQARFCETARADYLVIGRPITEAEDPVKAVEEIKKKIG